MRIGVVCPYSFDHPGGVQAHVIELAEILIGQGHEVRVLGPGIDRESVPDFVTLGGPTVSVHYNGSVARVALGPRSIRAVRRFIDEGEFDVLHIHEPNAPSYSLAALAVARGPIVATYHASATQSVMLRLVRPVLRPFLEKIQAGIAVSEMARRWQVEQLGGDPLLIPNGVDTAKYRNALARWQATSRPSDTQEPVRVAFLGRLDEPRKGLDIFLRALDAMEAPVQATVIGGGKHREVDRVDFVGRVSDERKADILAEADIYVAPNTGGESFGIVLVEAMAAGCAVVASDIEAFATVCDSESPTPAGVLFPVGDHQALAAHLDALVRDAPAREALVRAGQARSQLYDWENVAKQITAVYDIVAGAPGQGAVKTR